MPVIKKQNITSPRVTKKQACYSPRRKTKASARRDHAKSYVDSSLSAFMKWEGFKSQIQLATLVGKEMIEKASQMHEAAVACTKSAQLPNEQEILKHDAKLLEKLRSNADNAFPLLADGSLDIPRPRTPSMSMTSLGDSHGGAHANEDALKALFKRHVITQSKVNEEAAARRRWRSNITSVLKINQSCKAFEVFSNDSKSKQPPFDPSNLQRTAAVNKISTWWRHGGGGTPSSSKKHLGMLPNEVIKKCRTCPDWKGSTYPDRLRIAMVTSHRLFKPVHDHESVLDDPNLASPGSARSVELTDKPILHSTNSAKHYVVSYAAVGSVCLEEDIARGHVVTDCFMFFERVMSIPTPPHLTYNRCFPAYDTSRHMPQVVVCKGGFLVMHEVFSWNMNFDSHPAPPSDDEDANVHPEAESKQVEQKPVVVETSISDIPAQQSVCPIHMAVKIQKWWRSVSWCQIASECTPSEPTPRDGLQVVPADAVEGAHSVFPDEESAEQPQVCGPVEIQCGAEPESKSETIKPKPARRPVSREIMKLDTTRFTGGLQGKFVHKWCPTLHGRVLTTHGCSPRPMSPVESAKYHKRHDDIMNSPTSWLMRDSDKSDASCKSLDPDPHHSRARRALAIEESRDRNALEADCAQTTATCVAFYNELQRIRLLPVSSPPSPALSEEEEEEEFVPVVKEPVKVLEVEPQEESLSDHEELMDGIVQHLMSDYHARMVRIESEEKRGAVELLHERRSLRERTQRDRSVRSALIAMEERGRLELLRARQRAEVTINEAFKMLGTLLDSFVAEMDCVITSVVCCAASMAAVVSWNTSIERSFASSSTTLTFSEYTARASLQAEEYEHATLLEREGHFLQNMLFVMHTFLEKEACVREAVVSCEHNTRYIYKRTRNGSAHIMYSEAVSRNSLLNSQQDHRRELIESGELLHHVELYVLWQVAFPQAMAQRDLYKQWAEGVEGCARCIVEAAEQCALQSLCSAEKELHDIIDVRQRGEFETICDENRTCLLVAETAARWQLCTRQVASRTTALSFATVRTLHTTEAEERRDRESATSNCHASALRLVGVLESFTRESIDRNLQQCFCLLAYHSARADIWNAECTAREAAALHLHLDTVFVEFEDTRNKMFLEVVQVKSLMCHLAESVQEFFMRETNARQQIIHIHLTCLNKFVEPLEHIRRLEVCFTELFAWRHLLRSSLNNMWAQGAAGILRLEACQVLRVVGAHEAFLRLSIDMQQLSAQEVVQRGSIANEGLVSCFESCLAWIDRREGVSRCMLQQLCSEVEETLSRLGVQMVNLSTLTQIMTSQETMHRSVVLGQEEAEFVGIKESQARKAVVTEWHELLDCIIEDTAVMKINIHRNMFVARCCVSKMLHNVCAHSLLRRSWAALEHSSRAFVVFQATEEKLVIHHTFRATLIQRQYVTNLLDIEEGLHRDALTHVSDSDLCSAVSLQETWHRGAHETIQERALLYLEEAKTEILRRTALAVEEKEHFARVMNHYDRDVTHINEREAMHGREQDARNTLWIDCAVEWLNSLRVMEVEESEDLLRRHMEGREVRERGEQDMTVAMKVMIAVEGLWRDKYEKEQVSTRNAIEIGQTEVLIRMETGSWGSSDVTFSSQSSQRSCDDVDPCAVLHLGELTDRRDIREDEHTTYEYLSATFIHNLTLVVARSNTLSFSLTEEAEHSNRVHLVSLQNNERLNLYKVIKGLAQHD